MTDSREEKKQRNLKISELILSGKSLSRQIEELKKERFLRERVVDLSEYRRLKESPQPKTVLIVDAEESVRELLGKSVQDAGYEALTAGSEIELAKLIMSRSFDLILFDPRLPGVNGLELCALLKGNRVLRKIPVIFMSRDAGKDQVRKAFEAGCDEYVQKPFKLDQLLKILRYFLENP